MVAGITLFTLRLSIFSKVEALSILYCNCVTVTCSGVQSNETWHLNQTNEIWIRNQRNKHAWVLEGWGNKRPEAVIFLTLRKSFLSIKSYWNHHSINQVSNTCRLCPLNNALQKVREHLPVCCLQNLMLMPLKNSFFIF